MESTERYKHQLFLIIRKVDDDWRYWNHVICHKVKLLVTCMFLYHCLLVFMNPEYVDIFYSHSNWILHLQCFANYTISSRRFDDSGLSLLRTAVATPWTVLYVLVLIPWWMDGWMDWVCYVSLEIFHSYWEVNCRRTAAQFRPTFLLMFFEQRLSLIDLYGVGIF
jgi:hypothetical protein